MRYGNDIADHQNIDTVNLLKAGGKAEFIIMRPTSGTYIEDDHIMRFMSDVLKNGFPYGFYHAAYAGSVQDAILEADFCINTIEKYLANNKDISLPIFYDYEYFSVDYNNGRGIQSTPQFVRDVTIAFCNRVKERGYKAGVYLNKDFWDNYYGLDFFERHPDLYIWYARPGLSAPDRKCYLWQYASNNGSEYGYNGNIDKNILYDEFINNNKEEKIVKPISNSPIKLKIGFASSGDISTISRLIESLGIGINTIDGYIITSEASAGDQQAILRKCIELNVPCVEYKEETEPTDPGIPEVPEDCEKEIEELKKEIESLKEEVKEFKDKMSKILEIMSE